MPTYFRYLHRAIEQDFQAPNEKVKLKYLLTKVNVICKICQENAAQHGPDLLKPLNDIMNQCQNITIISQALKGITLLCQEGIIDVITTIKVLSPKYKADTRVPISKAFYSLLAVAPTFSLDNEEYISFLQSLLTMMWKYAYDDNLPMQIRHSIFRAMGQFPLNQHQLQMLPDFACSPDDQPQPEEGVPGQCWIRMLERDTKNLEILLVSLLKEEVVNLPRGAYHLSQAMKNKQEENANYNFLPETSIVRAIVSQLISKSGNDKALMSILSSVDHKLPPFDWRIFKPALSSNAKLPFISLLAKQCSTSFSAKSILQSLLQEWSTCEVALDIMPHFKHIFNGIELELLRPFVSQSLILWQQSSSKDKTCLNAFQSLLLSYIQVINDSEIEESKDDIVEAIIDLHQQELNEPTKDVFFEAILELPNNVLEKIIIDFDTSSALSIRRHLAVKKNEVCLPALNDLIDALAKEETDCDLETNSENIKTILDVSPNKQLKSWVLEIMGQLLFLLRQNCTFWTMQFMMEMFALGISSLAKEVGRISTFQDLPRILFVALEMHPDLGPQIAEWMVELYKYKPLLTKYYKEVLKKSFLTIKHCDGFKEATIWGKLTLLK